MLKTYEIHSSDGVTTLVNKCSADSEQSAEALLRQIGRIPRNHTVLMAFEV